MRGWDAEQLAVLAGSELLRAGTPVGPEPGPRSVGVDSRSLAPGALFVGLAGRREDGGLHGAAALAGGAWGILVRPEHAAAALAVTDAGTVLAHPDPLLALQVLARVWRETLTSSGARVIAVTGSTGKTSTKDILAALLAPFGAVAASPANLNTEIGLPLAILAAPADTRTLILEMAMRGPGQIAELTELAEPDVGVIVNVGHAHLELLGSLENIAAAKAELIAGLRPGRTIIIPAREPLLDTHLREDLRTVTFGEGGEVRLCERLPDGEVLIEDAGTPIRLRPSFEQAHQLRNLLAAVAAARALGHTPSGPLEVVFSAMRGQRSRLGGGIVMIDDCYNANPMSMRAAIDDLAESARGRSVAVLGDMLELGPQSEALHREVGEHARSRGVGLLVAVGPRAVAIAAGFAGEAYAAPDAAAAAGLVPDLLQDGDTVLLKASRGVGLELVAQALRGAGSPAGAPGGQR